MGKKFTKILTVNSNEVSLCTRYNSGANKQTEFEIVKDKQGENSVDIKPILSELVKYCECVPVEAGYHQTGCEAFIDFLNYWIEQDVNDCFYNLLSGALREAIWSLQHNTDLSKEQKAIDLQCLFDLFIEEFKQMPITKNVEGKYEVSLFSKNSNTEIEECGNTEDITKEKRQKMKNEEQLNVIQKAFETLKSALGLEKTETPTEETVVIEEKTEETVEEQPEEPVEIVDETVEKTVEVEAELEEAETPEVKEVVEEKVEEVVEEATEPTQEVAPEETVEEQQEEVVEEIVEPVVKAENTELEEVIKAKMEIEKELAELKKANEEREIAIEKMSFVQKAKDEFSMLVGTPEEIGEKLYSIAKSNLEVEVKDFIMEQLKSVSKKNSLLTKESGSIEKSDETFTVEDSLYQRAKELAKSKNISVNKALREIN